MKYKIDEIEYNVIVIKKNNKNTYVRVNDNLDIYVTTNYFTSMSSIKKILDDNYEYIKKMISKKENQIKKDNEFYLFGRKYDIVIDNVRNIYLEDNKIYVPDLKKFDKWLKKETYDLFKKHLDIIYDKFEEDIPYPNLKIRNMKTRWGVNNRKTKTVTLNTKLITFDVSKLDYVIVHELSHFVHFNHSKEFWSLVSKYTPDYKKIRKEMR